MIDHHFYGRNKIRAEITLIEPDTGNAGVGINGSDDLVSSIDF